jgi:peptide/nickel transport system permease protein
MLRFILRRILFMIPTLIAISILSFLIIQLPPGDFLHSYVSELRDLGVIISETEVISLREHYGLNDPIYVQYFNWMKGVVQGDLGISLQHQRPVSKILANRLPWSILISIMSFFFVWIVSIPIGMYSAVRQYSIADYIATFIGFIGLAIPNFLFALVALWLYFKGTGDVMVGLFSSEYVMAPWSLAKLKDLLAHLWIPMIIVGTAGTASSIRTMRANMLDELQKPYVMVARSRGIPEVKLLIKYPFRIALNPTMSTIGWLLPSLVGGELLVSLVLGLPTVAPVFVDALKNQDMFMAGSVVMILSVLTVIGTLISDIALAWVDPRIRESI